MPPSQLKTLKKSIKDGGLSRTSSSKKKKPAKAPSSITTDTRARRHSALQGIREQANPFEYRTSAAKKFDVTTNQTLTKQSFQQPSVTRSHGEDKRRDALLYERNRLKKLGGIVDRRFGETDQEMSLEQKAIERFTKEKERRSRGNAIFDLEDPDDGLNLTHLGRSLGTGDIYDRGSSSLQETSDRASLEVGDRQSRPKGTSKRWSNSEGEIQYGDDSSKDHLKSKKEAMEEVIAKSRLGRFERQKAKEDDDQLRAELDHSLPDLYSMLAGTSQSAIPEKSPGSLASRDAPINPDRLALIEGRERKKADIEYDERVRQMAVDERAIPARPTLTEEETQRREADRVRDLEDRRLERMQRKEPSPDAEDASSNLGPHRQEDDGMDFSERLTLGSGLASGQDVQPLDVEDEDNFFIEDVFDPVPSATEYDSDSNSEMSPVGDEEGIGYVTHESSDLISTIAPNGLQTTISMNSPNVTTENCPLTLTEMLQLTEKMEIQQVPAVIQNIRASTHPGLNKGNKAKLGTFAALLVDYIHALAKSPDETLLTVLDSIIRHLHSLAKTYPTEVGDAFRLRLRDMANERPNSFNNGDLIVLASVGRIFPTSDHFHQVVTPAMLCMTRYLSQTQPTSLRDLAKGTFVCTLCVSYQSLSKRFIPEVVNFVFRACNALASVEQDQSDSITEHRPWSESFRILALIEESVPWERGSLRFLDIATTKEDNEPLRQALLICHLELVQALIEMWSDQPAFCEIFAPFQRWLHGFQMVYGGRALPPYLTAQLDKASKQVRNLMQKAMHSRTPLQLHHHRPLPIKTSLPKFDESYNPDKHNDPDADRAELAKLRAQHKKERKGALRELRKDSRFLAKEDLREKKEADAAYEKKFKRLVSEIQGEEGHESNVYAKEKRQRTGKR